MKWILKKTFRFEASHQLPNHDGKCARLHGHSWVGRIEVKGKVLHQSGPKIGMVIDYADISKPINSLLASHLDHYHLNDSLNLQDPTSEEVARWILNHLVIAGLQVTAVEIEETCTSWCRYE